MCLRVSVLATEQHAALALEPCQTNLLTAALTPRRALADRLRRLSCCCWSWRRHSGLCRNCRLLDWRRHCWLVGPRCSSCSGCERLGNWFAPLNLRLLLTIALRAHTKSAYIPAGTTEHRQSSEHTTKRRGTVDWLHTYAKNPQLFVQRVGWVACSKLSFISLPLKLLILSACSARSC